jgi:manganese oxidase
MHMALPENTLPMMTGKGQFGAIEMGGMFTVLKVREDQPINDYQDPGWYQYPKGTVAYEWKGKFNEPTREKSHTKKRGEIELQVQKPQHAGH